MDLRPSQNNHNEGDRLQTSESLSGFFSRMTVSNKTMKKSCDKIPTSVHMMDSELEESLIPKEEILEELSNLYAGKLMFDIHPRIAYNLADQDFSRVLTLHQDFKRKDLMKEGNRPYSITYRIAYALSNTHHSDLFLRKEYIEIPRIFKEFAKVMAPDPIRIPRIGGVDIVIKDHPVLDRTMSSRIEFSSRMSFSEDRISGYKGKEKDSPRILLPQEIRQPVVGIYEGILEIAGHEFLVAGAAGRESGSMTLGLSFLEDHKPWGRKGIREAKIMIGGAFGTPWFRVLRREKAFNRIMPIKFRSKRGTHDTDSFYEESEEEIKNLREALMNMEDKKDMQMIIKEHINLGLIEPGISAYSSPGFLVRNHGEIKRGKPRYFHKGSCKIQKGFPATFERNGKCKVEMGGNPTQRVRELKQVCNNLPKLAIPQDEDELVVYTDANDYRWAAVLMKKTTTGEEPCRYTGGLFTEQQAQVAHQ
ncbi:UNVERIFIED_CONTAM: movement protein [Sesamum calycinum]|uniref:Movement protein n=1 Tax=Sesamum calycinum TaxID=2727403 RepID=A0AAW2JB54_9LAMI